MSKVLLIAKWQKIDLLSFKPFQISRAPKLPPSPSNACHAEWDTFFAIFITIMYCFMWSCIEFSPKNVPQLTICDWKHRLNAIKLSLKCYYLCLIFPWREVQVLTRRTQRDNYHTMIHFQLARSQKLHYVMMYNSRNTGKMSWSWV